MLKDIRVQIKSSYAPLGLYRRFSQFRLGEVSVSE